MTVSDLEKQLEAAQKQMIQALLEKRADYQSLSDLYSSLYRQLAEERMEEFIRTKVFPINDSGRPISHLLFHERSVYIVFPVYKQQKLDTAERVALIKLNQCLTHNLAHTESQLEIYGRLLPIEGLESFKMEVMDNSAWLKATISMYKDRSNSEPELWHSQKHYIIELPIGFQISELSFAKQKLFSWTTSHSMIFECLAKSYEAKILSKNLSNVLAEITKEIFTEEGV